MDPPKTKRLVPKKLTTHKRKDQRIIFLDRINHVISCTDDLIDD